MELDAPRTAAPPPDALPADARGACGGCGESRLGPYCHACGRLHQDERLTLRRLWTEFVARVLNFDRGLLHTAKALTLRPGPACRGYVGGERRLVSPLYYFVIGAGLALLAFSFEADTFREGMAASLRSQVAEGQFPASLLPPHLVDAYVAAVLRSVELTFTYQLLANAVFFALLLRLLFLRSGYNLAEVGAFALFTSGHLMLLSTLAGLALLPLDLPPDLSLGAGALLGAGLTAVYQSYAAAGFFPGRTAGVVARALFAIVLAFVVFGVLRDGLLLTYVLLTAA